MAEEQSNPNIGAGDGGYPSNDLMEISGDELNSGLGDSNLSVATMTDQQAIHSSPNSGASDGSDDLMEKGAEAWNRNRFKQSADCFRAALEIRIARYGLYASECFDAYHELGYATFLKYEEDKRSNRGNVADLNSAFQILNVAKEISEMHSFKETHKTVNLLNALAEVAEERGEFEIAFNHYRNALEILEKIDPLRRRILVLCYQFCLFLERRGRVRDAFRQCHKYLTVCRPRINELMEKGPAIASLEEKIKHMREQLENKLEDLKTNARKQTDSATQAINLLSDKEMYSNATSNAEELMQMGADAMAKEEYKKAVDCFGLALEIRVAQYGKDAIQCRDAYYELGRATFLNHLEKKGNVAEELMQKWTDALAKEEYTEAVDCFGPALEEAINYCSSLESRGRGEEAINYCIRYLSVCKSNQELLKKYSEIYVKDVKRISSDRECLKQKFYELLGKVKRQKN